MVNLFYYILLSRAFAAVVIYKYTPLTATGITLKAPVPVLNV